MPSSKYRFPEGAVDVAREVGPAAVHDAGRRRAVGSIAALGLLATAGSSPLLASAVAATAQSEHGASELRSRAGSFKPHSAFANFKLPQGTVDAARKEEIIHRTTAMFVEYFGEGARPFTMVLVDEVADGGWGRADSRTPTP